MKIVFSLLIVSLATLFGSIAGHRNKGVLDVHKVLTGVLSGKFIEHVLGHVDRLVPNEQKAEVRQLVREIDEIVKELLELTKDGRKLLRMNRMISELELKHNEFGSHIKGANIKTSPELEVIFQD